MELPSQLSLPLSDKPLPESVQETLKSIRALVNDEAEAREAYVTLSEDERNDLEEAILTNADTTSYKGMTEDAIITLAEKILNKDRNFREARAAFFVALKRNANLKVCWKNCGNAYLDESFSEIAALCYKRAIMCDQDYGDAWYDLGIASTALNLWEEAKMCYRRAVDINHQDTDALNNLGLLFYREEKHELALALFEAAVAQRPTASDLIANKCLCLASLNRKQEAYEEYRRGLELISIPSSTLLNNFVILLYSMGHFDEMLHYAYKLLQVKPTSYRAWSHIGTALKSKGEVEGALHAYRASVQLEPHYFEGWTYLASIFGRRGRYAEAIGITTTTQTLYQLPTQMLPGLFYQLTAYANHVVENRTYD